MATVADAPKVKEKRARERLTEKRLEALAVKAGMGDVSCRPSARTVAASRRGPSSSTRPTPCARG